MEVKAGTPRDSTLRRTVEDLLPSDARDRSPDGRRGEGVGEHGGNGDGL